VNTSAEAFTEMFRFFTGSEPVKSDIVPQRPRRLTVSGRAVLFPQNVGVEDATLRIWRLDPRRAAGRAPTRWTRHRSPPTDPGLPTNFLNPQTSPISNQTNGMIVYVVDSDGVSDLSAPIPEFAALPFQSGVDLFIPAARPPTRRCRLRCGRGLRAGSTVSFPNRPSTASQHIVVFNDFDTRLTPPRLGFAQLRSEPAPRALHPKRAELPRQRTVRFRMWLRNRGDSWAERARVWRWPRDRDT
jgi:hypothetical protein